MTRTERSDELPIVRKPGRPFNRFEGTSLSREHALAKALEIVAEQSMSGLTMQALAKSLNTSRAPIYALFSSRKQLAEELIDLILARIFVENTRPDDDWKDALRAIGQRAFSVYRDYPGTASYLTQSGFPDTEVGRRSSRMLSHLMHGAGAPPSLIPTLIFVSTAMITGADLNYAGQSDRELRGSKSSKERDKLERRRGETLPLKPMDTTTFLTAIEIVLLGIEAAIEQHHQR